MMHHDDFASEPIPGLPERPPAGERILWQGRPGAWALACDAFNLKWVAAYFVGLAVWRFVAAVDLMPVGHALSISSPFLVMGAGVCALLALIAWVLARATVYTITDARVAMRIGAALTVTLNLPFTRIARIDLVERRNGTGTLALAPEGRMPLGFLVLWPHARPWHFGTPQPALRCIPDAAQVGRLLAEAAEARLSVPQVAPQHPAAVAVAAE